VVASSIPAAGGVAGGDGTAAPVDGSAARCSWPALVIHRALSSCDARHVIQAAPVAETGAPTYACVYTDIHAYASVYMCIYVCDFLVFVVSRKRCPTTKNTTTTTTTATAATTTMTQTNKYASLV
jgi:hypothetical protein